MVKWIAPAKAEAQLRGRSTPAGPIRADLGDHASALVAGSDETDAGAIGRRKPGQRGSGRRPVCRLKPEKRGCSQNAGNLPRKIGQTLPRPDYCILAILHNLKSTYTCGNNDPKHKE